jgi:hypothetical protein
MADNKPLELTGLSRAEIEVGFVVVLCLLARLVLQSRPAAQLFRWGATRSRAGSCRDCHIISTHGDMAGLDPVFPGLSATCACVTGAGRTGCHRYPTRTCVAGNPSTLLRAGWWGVKLRGQVYPSPDSLV